MSDQSSEYDSDRQDQDDRRELLKSANPEEIAYSTLYNTMTKEKRKTKVKPFATEKRVRVI